VSPGTYIILILLTTAFTASGRQAAVPRDTSFNIPATLQKERKHRPYITVANPTRPKSVVIGTDVTYRTIGECELKQDIFYPKKHRRLRPAVLMIFGGGWRSGDKSHNHAMGIELAKHGYVAVSAEYRLSPEAIYPAAVYDLKAALRWMRANASQFGIDTARIAALGCSAGGQLAALIGTTNGNDRFEDKIGYGNYSSGIKAVVDIDGTLAFHHPESVEGAVAAQWLGGSYEQKPEVWTEAAPLAHVDKSTAAFLFVNSSIPRFHAGRDDMIRKLNALGIYSEVHTLEDTPHPFWFFNPWFEPMMEFVIAFLDKQLKR
jgi:pectinesterase